MILVGDMRSRGGQRGAGACGPHPGQECRNRDIGPLLAALGGAPRPAPRPHRPHGRGARGWWLLAWRWPGPRDGRMAHWTPQCQQRGCQCHESRWAWAAGEGSAGDMLGVAGETEARWAPDQTPPPAGDRQTVVASGNSGAQLRRAGWGAPEVSGAAAVRPCPRSGSSGHRAGHRGGPPGSGGTGRAPRGSAGDRRLPQRRGLPCRGVPAAARGPPPRVSPGEVAVPCPHRRAPPRPAGDLDPAVWVPQPQSRDRLAAGLRRALPLKVAPCPG